MENDNIVSVFVTNRKYIEYFYNSCYQLIKIGNFKGDIVLIIGDDLTIEELSIVPFIVENKIIILKYPDIDFPPHVMNVIRSLKTGDDRHITKIFCWHKINIFRSYFKKWDYVFYLDVNLKIYGDISPILNLREKNKILAHDDAYPYYHVFLEDQFDKTSEPFQLLSKKYNMKCRYFQTTCMLFDTNLITETTFWELQDLALRYPCCGNNEQGFMSLYFCVIKPSWIPYKIGDENKNYYDIYRRDSSKPYLISKG